jgi:hypothetical protein
VLDEREYREDGQIHHRANTHMEQRGKGSSNGGSRKGKAGGSDEEGHEHSNR